MQASWKVSFFCFSLTIFSLLFSLEIQASNQIDVNQSSGGYSQGLTYNGTRWIEQTFVPNQNNISQVRLRMLCNLPGVCGQSYETISVVIQDSNGSSVSSQQTIPLSTLGSSFGWITITFGNFFQVTPGQTYKIRVYYNGYQLEPNPVLYWDRSTSDVYSSGSHQMYGNISGPQDFTFQTYYESTACYDSTPVSCGTGACQQTISRCANGVFQSCTPRTPTTETCNNIDDNCDGQVDEGLGNVSCGLGACRRTVSSCVGGALQSCVAGPSTSEICDGTDNDCDGQVDEGLTALSCGTGACQRTGITACVAGVSQTCTPGAPSTEVCDGIDNNCDAQVDEGLGSTTCGAGICRTTVLNCLNGQPQSCTPGATSVEICDGIDNDCDGQTDEGLATLSCGTGACRRTGITACVTGVPQTCTPGTPSTEVCDGVDNNCDGQVDEGLGTVSCGSGVCRRTVSSCVGGVTQSCVAGNPSSELCDGVDNNCDGQTDESIAPLSCGTGACLRTGIVACVAGVSQTCTPGTPSAEVCDGIDNNCDGSIDENCAQANPPPPPTPPPVPAPAPSSSPPPPTPEPSASPAGNVGSVGSCQFDSDCAGTLRCVDQICTAALPDMIVISGQLFSDTLNQSLQSVAKEFVPESANQEDWLKTIRTIAQVVVFPDDLNNGIKSLLSIMNNGESILWTSAKDKSGKVIWKAVRLSSLGQYEMALAGAKDELSLFAKSNVIGKAIKFWSDLLETPVNVGGKTIKVAPLISIGLAAIDGWDNKKGDTDADQLVSFSYYTAGSFLAGATGLSLAVTVGEVGQGSIEFVYEHLCSTSQDISSPIEALIAVPTFYPALTSPCNQLDGGITLVRELVKVVKIPEKIVKSDIPSYCGSVRGALVCGITTLMPLNEIASPGFSQSGADFYIQAWNEMSLSHQYPLGVIQVNGVSSGSDEVTVNIWNGWNYVTPNDKIYIGATLLDSQGTYTCNLPYNQITLKPGETKNLDITLPKSFAGTSPYSLIVRSWAECDESCQTGPDGCFVDGCCRVPLTRSDNSLGTLSLNPDGSISSSTTPSGGCSLLN